MRLSPLDGKQQQQQQQQSTVPAAVSTASTYSFWASEHALFLRESVEIAFRVLSQTTDALRTLLCEP